jgi:hypothetical protein
MTTNRAGCIALIDGDSSPTSCAAKLQAFESCSINACLVCPYQYVACSAIANTSVCKSFAADAQCANNAKYSVCNAGSLDMNFKALGRMFCAGAADSGTD